MSKNTLLTILILPLIIVYGMFAAWVVRSIIEKYLNKPMRLSYWPRWLGVRGVNRIFILLLALIAFLSKIGYPLIWFLLGTAMLISLVNWGERLFPRKRAGLKDEKNIRELK